MSTVPKHIAVPELLPTRCTGCVFFPDWGDGVCQLPPVMLCDPAGTTIFIPDTPEGKVAYATKRLTA